MPYWFSLVAFVSIGSLFAIFATVFDERTDLWGKCGCEWENWEEWSECSQECNGRKSRSRKLRMYTERDGCPFEFKTCATSRSAWDNSRCNAFCYNGGTSNTHSCKCVVGFYGFCCEFQRNCGDPGSVYNGKVRGSTFTYGSTVTYSCNSGYILVDGDSQRTCTIFTVWSGKKPRCAYYRSCSSSPCKNNAICNNLPDDYRCDCRTGWSGRNCEIDIQPPSVTQCSSDIYRNTSDVTVDVNWIEPVFTDLHNFSVNVSSNYPRNTWTFPWGDFIISYSATKPSNGMSTECRFMVKIRPNPCSPLQMPTNAAILCNNWKVDYGQFCTALCAETFTVPRGIKPNKMFVCAASGRWMPSNQMPSCSVSAVRSSSLQGYIIGESFKSCELEKVALQRYYIDLLNSSPFSYFCKKYNDECNPNNVLLKCPN